LELLGKKEELSLIIIKGRAQGKSLLGRVSGLRREKRPEFSRRAQGGTKSL